MVVIGRAFRLFVLNPAPLLSAWDELFFLVVYQAGLGA
jgi:hypothetical protein